jgi:hypothetical protein
VITKADLEQPWMEDPLQKVIAAALAEVGYSVIPPDMDGAAVGLPLDTPVHIAYRARAMAQLFAGKAVSTPAAFLDMWSKFNVNTPPTDADLKSIKTFYDLHGGR